MADGIVPVSVLFCKSRSTSEVKFDIDGGMGPLSLFEYSLSTLNSRRFPIELGILPLNLFSPNPRNWSFSSLPMESGMGPDNFWSLLRSSFLRKVRFPIEGGMVPDMLGKGPMSTDKTETRPVGGSHRIPFQRQQSVEGVHVGKFCSGWSVMLCLRLSLIERNERVNTMMLMGQEEKNEITSIILIVIKLFEFW
ncbi:unnamed protein product [Cuscuta campestris]|uniref:Uncharacterized protein n=1 Tax=Cuscuta campestris TaxID=132261 RepID=A0A484NQR9_9ASTE|nr:unnamed protein product [Cuscuta campestris]